MRIVKILLIKTAFISTIAFSLNVQMFVNSSCSNYKLKKSKKNNSIECYDLGKPRFLVDQINKAIYGKPSAQAEQQAEEIIKQDKPQFMQAVIGMRLAHTYQLKRLPAIVINNGEYTVYGTTDIGECSKNCVNLN